MKKLSAKNKKLLENLAYFFLVNWGPLGQIRLENLILDMLDGKYRVRVPVSFIPELGNHHEITPENNHAYWFIDKDPTKLAYFGRQGQEMSDHLADIFLRALDRQLPEIIISLENRKDELARQKQAMTIIANAKDGKPKKYNF